MIKDISKLYRRFFPEKDLTPPSRIKDLRSNFEDGDNIIVVKWTAPGDDYSNGRGKQQIYLGGDFSKYYSTNQNSQRFFLLKSQ